MSKFRLLTWLATGYWIELLSHLLLISFLFWGCSAVCGQTYELRVQYQDGTAGGGSAVCVGRAQSSGDWIFVTAGHVVDGGNRVSVDGNRGRNVRFAQGMDLASFEVPGGEFVKTRIVKDWPDGINAQVCGFGYRNKSRGVRSPRNTLCFEGSIARVGRGGRIKAANQVTIPGDSGGAVMVQTGQRRCLAGVHWGYGCDQFQQRCDSEFVTGEQICQHLTQIYGDCPDCQQWPQVINRPRRVQQISQQQPPVRLLPSQSQQVVVAPCQEDIRRMVAEYMQANPVRSGRDGVDGRTPEVDYQRIVGQVVEAIPRPRDGVDGQPGRDGQSVSVDQVAQYLLANHRAEITGPSGQRGERGSDGQQGPQGERGLVAVPDDQDIRNWLVGAMSDPQTRTMMSQLLVELAAEDPRTTDLIRRLESLENRRQTQRVMIVDDQKNVLDDETFKDGEPIILNLRQLQVPQSTTQP